MSTTYYSGPVMIEIFTQPNPAPYKVEISVPGIETIVTYVGRSNAPDSMGSVASAALSFARDVSCLMDEYDRETAVRYASAVEEHAWCDDKGWHITSKPSCTHTGIVYQRSEDIPAHLGLAVEKCPVCRRFIVDV